MEYHKVVKRARSVDQFQGLKKTKESHPLAKVKIEGGVKDQPQSSQHKQLSNRQK